MSHIELIKEKDGAVQFEDLAMLTKALQELGFELREGAKVLRSYSTENANDNSEGLIAVFSLPKVRYDLGVYKQVIDGNTAYMVGYDNYSDGKNIHAKVGNNLRILRTGYDKLMLKKLAVAHARRTGTKLKRFQESSRLNKKGQQIKELQFIYE